MATYSTAISRSFVQNANATGLTSGSTLIYTNNTNIMQYVEYVIFNKFGDVTNDDDVEIVCQVTRGTQDLESFKIPVVGGDYGPDLGGTTRRYALVEPTDAAVSEYATDKTYWRIMPGFSLFFRINSGDGDHGYEVNIWQEG